jgi:FimV-like protein
MEGVPISESLPTKEIIIEKIRTEGKTEKTVELVRAWYEAMRKSESSGLDTARTQAELADFYIEMGDLDAAEETLTDVVYMAQQEGDEELYLFAQSKLVVIDEMRG